MSVPPLRGRPAPQDFNDDVLPNTTDMAIPSSSSPSPAESTSAAMYSYQYIGMYLSVPIFLLGVVGNILTICVIRRRAFQKSTASVYLTLLAIVDTSMLVTGIPHEWLEWFDIDMVPWVCRLHRFFFYMSSDVGMWTVVLFTFDRFIAVCFPLRKRSVCQPRNAGFAFAGIVTLWAVKNLHIFWTRGEEYHPDGTFYRNCGYLAEYAYFEYYIRPWIVFVFIMLMPFVSVLILNGLIVGFLLRSDSIRHMSASAATSKRQPYKQTTVMCLCVSFTCVVCIAPSIVLMIGKPYWKSGKTQNHAYDIAKVINNQLVYFNHAINFCLYCMSGERFRSELVAMFGWSKKDSTQVSSPLTSPTKATYQMDSLS